ncbi:hypothetical protein JCM1840_000559 [Sporobolomyces johnsonii]
MMALSEIGNTLQQRASSNNSDSSITAVKTTPCDSDAHPWAAGRKILQPATGEPRRFSQRIRKKSGFDDLTKATSCFADNVPEIEGEEHCTRDSNDLTVLTERMKSELAKVKSEKEQLLRAVGELHHTVQAVQAERDAVRLDFGQQEDELFVLRDLNESRAKEVEEARQAREFAEVERDLLRDAKEQLEREKDATIDSLRSSNAALQARLEKVQQELEEVRSNEDQEQEAWNELRIEQEKLAAAYDDALVQLGSCKCQRSSFFAEEEEGVQSHDSLADVSADWDKIDVERDLAASPHTPSSKSGLRKGAMRALVGVPSPSCAFPVAALKKVSPAK